jgi:UDP-glucose 4-epimerase
MVLTTSPVVVTGSNGFIGRALCAQLAAEGVATRALSRADYGDLATADDGLLDDALRGAGAVVHLSGRAHVMRETSANPPDAYRVANAVATERLAHAASRAGAARFVFASTVKVNGDASPRGRAFRAMILRRRPTTTHAANTTPNARSGKLRRRVPCNR